MTNEELQPFSIKPKNTFNLPSQYLTEEFDRFKQKRKIAYLQYNSQSSWKKGKSFPVKQYKAIRTMPNGIEMKSNSWKTSNDNDYFIQVATMTSPNSQNIQRIVDIMKSKEQTKSNVYAPHRHLHPSLNMNKEDNRICKRSNSTFSNKVNRSSIGNTMKRLLKKRKSDFIYSYILQVIDTKY